MITNNEISFHVYFITLLSDSRTSIAAIDLRPCSIGVSQTNITDNKLCTAVSIRPTLIIGMHFVFLCSNYNTGNNQLIHTYYYIIIKFFLLIYIYLYFKCIIICNNLLCFRNLTIFYDV